MMRKITTLRGLKKAVKELAGKEYHLVRETIREPAPGVVERSFEGYINGGKFTADCSDPAKVLRLLEKEMKPYDK